MIALAHTAAILLDHKTGTVRPIDYDGQLDTLKALLGCEWVDGTMLDRKNILFCDEEWLEKKYEIGFQIRYQNTEIKFAGSGLITGDDAGRNAPLDLNHTDLEITVFKL